MLKSYVQNKEIPFCFNHFLFEFGVKRIKVVSCANIPEVFMCTERSTYLRQVRVNSVICR